MLRFLPTVDRPHLKRLPGSVLWLPFLPNKKVPPPAGCYLKYWERVKFQTHKPSTAVSNPSVKNRLRRADFCPWGIDHTYSASPEPILWFLSCGCKKGTPPAGCHVRNRKCLTTPPAFCPDKKPPPLTRGGMGAVRTRRTGVGAVRGGRLQDLRR